MPYCPKCHRHVPESDTAELSDVYWGKCVRCDLLFRVLPESQQRRPPEAEFELLRVPGGLKMIGTSRGLLRSISWSLDVREESLDCRWRSGALFGKTSIPRMRLQSVEPFASNETKAGKSGYGILISYWHVGRRRKVRLRKIRIPIRTATEQFWLLNEICGFLDKTMKHSTPASRYRAKEYFGNDALEMFFENRVICLRISCPRCGFLIPAEQINIAGGTARCSQKFCRHFFSWQEIFESPMQEEQRSMPPPTIRVFGYGDLSHVRAIHFPAAANPLQFVPFGVESPPIPTPKAMLLKRPVISRKTGSLVIALTAWPRSLFFAFWTFAILTVGIFWLLIGMSAGLGYLPPEAASGSSSSDHLFAFFALALLASACFLIFRARLYSHWGHWRLEVGDGVVAYKRRCGPLRKRIVLPLTALSELGARMTSGRGIGAESFATYQIRFRYGRRQFILPCNDPEEQLWILMELYESLRGGNEK